VRSATNGYVPPKEAWALAEEQLTKAAAIDPNDKLVRSARLSRRFLADWDFPGTEREFEELSTEPWVVHRMAFHPIAMSFWARGRPQDSVALLERALRVDPGNPETRIMMADFLAHAGRLDEAIQHYRGIAADESGSPLPWFGLAAVFERRDDVGAAIAALRKAYELSGEESGAMELATARTEKDYEHAKAAVARRELASLEEYAKERYISPLDFARLHARLGERDKAFARLTAALAERSPGLIYLKVDQAWDPIRDDPRFAAIVRKVGIP
jgi:serine/threonine-protein kinase